MDISYTNEINAVIKEKYGDIDQRMNECLPDDVKCDNIHSREMGGEQDELKPNIKPEIETEQNLSAGNFAYSHDNKSYEKNLKCSEENKDEGFEVQIKTEQMEEDEMYESQIYSENQQQTSVLEDFSGVPACYNESQSTMFIENAFCTEDPFSIPSENDVVSQSLSSTMKMKFHICKECGKVYRSAWKLMSHLRKKHFPDQPYICPHCGVYHDDKAEMKEHFKLHAPVIAKPYKCTICSASYYTPSKLESHIWMHNGNRPYTCGLCLKSFTWSGGLRDHLKIHTGERPFSCNFCDKTFPDTSKLKNHQRIHTGEKPHVCQYCGKGFIESGKLKRHLRTHTGEKPYKCDFCSKSFNVISNLQKHMSVHSGEKPFVCNVCGRGFAQNVNLKSHSKIHNREKDPYKCKICDRRFERILDARTHSCTGSQKGKVKKKSNQIKPSVSRTGRKYKKKYLSTEYLYDEDAITTEIENAYMQTEKPNIAAETKSLDSSVQGACNVGDQAINQDENDDDGVQDFEIHDEDEDSSNVDEIEDYGIEKAGNYHDVEDIGSSDFKGQTNNDQVKYSKGIEYSDEVQDLRNYDEVQDFGNSYKVQDFENNDEVASVFQNEGQDDDLCDKGEEKSIKCKNSDSCNNEMADFTDLTNYNQEDEEKVRKVIEKIMNTAELYKPRVTQEFPCKFCGRSFRQMTKLRKHEKIHSGVRPYTCKFCGKSFLENSKLTLHLRTHTGERPHQCILCQKTFSVISNLRKHMAIHSGEKPYVCIVCGRGFTQNANLKSHMRIHTGEKDPYKCEICQTRFGRIENARAHNCPGPRQAEKKPEQTVQRKRQRKKKTKKAGKKADNHDNDYIEERVIDSVADSEKSVGLLENKNGSEEDIHNQGSSNPDEFCDEYNEDKDRNEDWNTNSTYIDMKTGNNRSDNSVPESEKVDNSSYDVIIKTEIHGEDSGYE